MVGSKSAYFKFLWVFARLLSRKVVLKLIPTNSLWECPLPTPSPTMGISILFNLCQSDKWKIASRLSLLSFNYEGDLVFFLLIVSLLLFVIFICCFPLDCLCFIKINWGIQHLSFSICYILPSCIAFQPCFTLFAWC